MQRAGAAEHFDQPADGKSLEPGTLPQHSNAASTDPWMLIGELLNAYAQIDDLFGRVIARQPNGRLNDREQRTRQESYDVRDHVLAILHAHADKRRSIERVNQLKVLLNEIDADPLLAYVCRPALIRLAKAIGIL